MLCEITERPPEGPEWRYELKLDGYRAIGFKTDGRTQLWSHNGKDFVGRLPGGAKALAYLPEQRRPTVRLSPSTRTSLHSSCCKALAPVWPRWCFRRLTC